MKNGKTFTYKILRDKILKRCADSGFIIYKLFCNRNHINITLEYNEKSISQFIFNNFPVKNKHIIIQELKSKIKENN